MANQPKNGAKIGGDDMPHAGIFETDLADLYELNLSFLALLSRRARARASCLGLERWAGSLARLKDDHGQRLARLPRALFRVEFQSGSAGVGQDAVPDSLEAQRRAFAAGALFALWQLARRRSPVATLLFQLPEASVHELARAGVDDLVAQATQPNAIRAAELDDSLWEAALGGDGEEPSRRIVLAMLARPEPLPQTLGVSLYGAA